MLVNIIWITCDKEVRILADFQARDLRRTLSAEIYLSPGMLNMLYNCIGYKRWSIQIWF